MYVSYYESTCKAELFRFWFPSRYMSSNIKVIAMRNHVRQWREQCLTAGAVRLFCHHSDSSANKLTGKERPGILLCGNHHHAYREWEAPTFSKVRTHD